jgi:hypothetical protein
MFLPGMGPASRGRSSEPTPEPILETGLSASEAQCVRLVYDLAERVRRSVRLVDIGDPPMPESAVEAKFGSWATFPILVGPDGARLAGQENFTPKIVRRFLKSH